MFFQVSNGTSPIKDKLCRDLWCKVIEVGREGNGVYPNNVILAVCSSFSFR